jgi:hypothetical protein
MFVYLWLMRTGKGGGVYSANFPTIQDFTQELKSRIAQNEFIKAQNFNASTYTNS